MISLYEIEDAFVKHVDRLRRLDYNVLDVKATRWHDDYCHFKNGMRVSACAASVSI